MKKCPYCGLENPDEAAMCSTCHTQFVDPSPTPAPPLAQEYEMSWEEKRFWERMTFRQLAVLIVRLQALWLFFDGLIDATYLPRYLANLPRIVNSYPLASQVNPDLFWMVLRILLNVAAGLALIMYTDRILSWLVKDAVAKSPPSAAAAH